MRKIVMMLAGIFAAADALPAWAQTNDSGDQFETVIVTARKRAEDAQTVPIAITAFDQSQLDTLNVKTVQDLTQVSPSVYVSPTTFRQDTLQVTIRGQRDFDSSSGQAVMSFDPAAAVYMDGVYLARPVGLTAALFDVDSLEVLKGPQGTLVGRNSTGGAVLYTTKEPTDQFGGYVKVTGGDYARGEVQAAINIPLSDHLFFRAATDISNQKGYLANYYTDPATGFSNHQASEGSDKIGANFSLKYVGDDSFNIILRANLSAEHDTGSSYHNLSIFPGSGTRNGKPAICNVPGTCNTFTDLRGHVVGTYYTTVTATTVSGVSTNPNTYNTLEVAVPREQTEGFWSVEQEVSSQDVGHYQTLSGTVNKRFGDIDVKWLTGYRWWDNRGTSVSRGLPYDTVEYIYQVPDYSAVQSELTVNGTALDSSLKWTAGLFFFQESSPGDGGLFYLYLPSAGVPTAAAGKQITEQIGTGASQRNTSYAGYAQATWTVLPDTRVTAGLRYTYDERNATISTLDNIFPASQATTNAVNNGIFDPGPVTFNGITYTGQTHACALTDPNGKLLPVSACSPVVNASFHKPTWTFAIDHDLWEGTLVYATTRSGYRSGAINSTAINPVVTVARPENVQDYEIGVKSDWDLLGVPMRTNLDAYYSDYHDIQTLVTLPNITIASAIAGGPCTQAIFNANGCQNTTNDNVTLNAKTAHIHGVEWDLTAKPVPSLTLNASGSFLDARYTDFSYTPPPGYLLPATGTTLTGSPFPLPEWQTNETATWATGLNNIAGLPLDDLLMTAHYYWQSRYLANMTGFDPSQRTWAYGMLNLRVEALNIAGANADLSFFMTNVTGTKACLPEYNGVLGSTPQGSFGIPNTSGVLQCVPLAPRMSGLTLEYRY